MVAGSNQSSALESQRLGSCCAHDNSVANMEVSQQLHNMLNQCIETMVAQSVDADMCGNAHAHWADMDSVKQGCFHIGYHSTAQIVANLLHMVVQLVSFPKPVCVNSQETQTDECQVVSQSVQCDIIQEAEPEMDVETTDPSNTKGGSGVVEDLVEQVMEIAQAKGYVISESFVHEMALEQVKENSISELLEQDMEGNAISRLVEQVLDNAQASGCMVLQSVEEEKELETMKEDVISELAKRDIYIARTRGSVIPPMLAQKMRFSHMQGLLMSKGVECHLDAELSKPPCESIEVQCDSTPCETTAAQCDSTPCETQGVQVDLPPLPSTSNNTWLFDQETQTVLQSAHQQTQTLVSAVATRDSHVQAEAETCDGVAQAALMCEACYRRPAQTCLCGPCEYISKDVHVEKEDSGVQADELCHCCFDEPGKTTFCEHCVKVSNIDPPCNVHLCWECGLRIAVVKGGRCTNCVKTEKQPPQPSPTYPVRIGGGYDMLPMQNEHETSVFSEAAGKTVRSDHGRFAHGAPGTFSSTSQRFNVGVVYQPMTSRKDSIEPETPPPITPRPAFADEVLAFGSVSAPSPPPTRSPSRGSRQRPRSAKSAATRTSGSKAVERMLSSPRPCMWRVMRDAFAIRDPPPW